VWLWEMPSTVLGSHARYNATISTTSQPFTGQSFNIAYASGSVYGNVWLDDVSISGNEGTILITGNPIECAQVVGGAFSSLPAVDGILGLNAWVNDQESPSFQQTWLNYVLTSGSFPCESSLFTDPTVTNFSSGSVHCCVGARWDRDNVSLNSLSDIPKTSMFPCDLLLV
jgi:hypothetical protein